ncbi:VCBS repeat-containing protein [Actinoplanes sp. LDG1-06]|uniref:VCBS repeat-containing protein n=1 Tax=Paractinoplanes ovalisporus TaxID=2810368 RepID=A0ABS2AHK1_9ACTN|nr:FG-GAP-like repeat-containing protein [Actinoplanes ovalisporus]MBM2619334.1 VCBS repeat-containing protein [Actinoplanes ovalisporus]
MTVLAVVLAAGPSGAARSGTAEPAAATTMAGGGTSSTVRSSDWTHINATFPTQSYWGRDRARAKVGFSNWESPAVTYRSFFLFDFAGWQGRTITGATLLADLDSSPTCVATPTDLYLTRTVSRSQSVTWKGFSGRDVWHTRLSSASGRAHPGCGNDTTMEWGNVRAAVRDAARTGGKLTLGLRASNEHDRRQWKKFFIDRVRLAITWNVAPARPAGLSTVPPTPCGTAENPTPLNTTTPAFSAQLADPYRDNIRGTVDIREGDQRIHASVTPAVVSGSVVAWPAVPPDRLPADQPRRVFRYLGRTHDGQLPSGWTSPCYFTVDTTGPAAPTVSSTDFPDGEAVQPTGRTGTVRFGPGHDGRGRPETDIAGYRYGFQQDRMTGWVAADPAGNAVLPMILWTASRTLYVQAVDRAGNPSAGDAPCRCASWDLRAHPSGAVPAGIPGDVDGDGRADVSTTVDLGHGRTVAWTLPAEPTGGMRAQPYLGWDTGINGGSDGYRIKPVRGDFTGDGLADIALFRDDPDTRLRLFLLRSDGHGYEATGTPLWEGPAGSAWRLNTIEPVAADADGDGRLDLSVLLRLGDGRFTLNVLRNASDSFAAPAEWWRSTAGSGRPARVVGGDFNGDGRDDIAYVSPDQLSVHMSTGASYGAPKQQPQEGRDIPVAGDVTGDGRTDIVQMHDAGASTQLLLRRATTDGFAPPALWWDGTAAGPAFAAAKATLLAGDYDSDGREDIAAVYDPTGISKVHLFLSGRDDRAVAPDLDAPAWSGPIGADAGPFSPAPGRHYRLIAAPGGWCATAAGTAVRLEPCRTGSAGQRVSFVPVGSGPFYNVVFAPNGQCLDVSKASHEDSASVRLSGCHTAGNKQFRWEHRAGTGLDTEVRIRPAHSDKCLRIANAAVVQGPCTDQSFVIRLEVD